MGNLLQAVGRIQPYVDVLPPPIVGQRAPATSDTNHAKGQLWIDESVSPSAIYTHLGSGDWDRGGNNLATTTVPGIVLINTDGTLAGADNTTVPTSLAVKTYADALAIAGSPDANETTKGIAELATQGETVAYTDDTRIVTPLKLGQAFAAPAALGTGTPAAGTFTDLTADGTGVVTLVSNAAALFDVTGAGVDLTLSSDAGRVIVNGEEAAANAITLLSAAGGIDADCALQMNLASSQNAADAIRINASAGGIDIDAAGAAGEDIDIANAAGSVNLTAGEAIATAMVFTATSGGIDLTAGGGAGIDIDLTCTSGSINLTAGENASDSIVLSSTNGGIDISATGAAAGEDIDITASSSINLTSTEDAALAVYLHANGGTSETIRLRADQGTGAASVDLLSDVGGITLTAGLGTADAINLSCSDAAGGIDIDAGTAGVIVDTTGGISLDAAAACNFTATGAFDITLNSTLGSMLINGGEAAADAVNIDASNAAGGIDIDAGTGGIAIDTTGALSLDSAAASNYTVTGAFDLTLASTAGSVNVTAGEAAADAIRVNASDAAGGMDFDCGTGGFALDSTGALSLDGAAASNFSVSGAGIDLTLASSGGRVVMNGEEAAADALRLLSAAGGLDCDVALQMNLTSSQNAADAIRINASAGGIDIDAAGAAGEDITLDNAAGSIGLTAGEAAADAIVLTASDAAGGIQLLAGTGGIVLGAGLNLAVTARATAGGTYTVDGDDYIIDTDSTGGAFQINLPAAPSTGDCFLIYDGAGQAAIGGNVTVSGNGNNIAAGGASAATYVLNTAFESLWVCYNGTLWMGRAAT